MKNRKIINPTKLKFTPFNSYGKKISGMSRHKISYDKNTGAGSYILKMAPGARSLNHKHQNYEEFYVLDGELIDEDNTTFNNITLTDEGYQTGSSGIKVFSGSTPLTGTASPQVQVRWKIVGSSLTSENKIHGVSLQWK